MVDKDEFQEHLKRAAETVETWPEWKRNVLNHSMKAMNDTPRSPVCQDSEIDELRRENADLRKFVRYLRSYFNGQNPPTFKEFIAADAAEPTAPTVPQTLDGETK